MEVLRCAENPQKSIFKMKAGNLCLAHALIIAIARVHADHKYKSCRYGYGMKQPVQNHIIASGLDKTNGVWFKEIQPSQIIFRTIKLLWKMVQTMMGSFSAEIPFRTRNVTYYMMVDTKTLRIRKVQ